jgi:hypothetical protein
MWVILFDDGKEVGEFVKGEKVGRRKYLQIRTLTEGFHAYGTRMRFFAGVNVDWMWERRWNELLVELQVKLTI